MQRLRDGSMSLFQVYGALYASYVFSKRSRSHIRSVTSALQYVFGISGEPVYSLDPFWPIRVREIVNSERTQALRHGCTLTIEGLTQVSETWLKTGTALDLWRCSVLWVSYFLALRSADLLSCQSQWFDVSFSKFWIKTRTPTTKTSMGRYDAYLPKLRGGYWDLEFWLKILEQYRNPDAIYLFVVPGQKGKGCMKFTGANFSRYFLDPLNNVLSDLGLLGTGKSFTTHSFRYTLASSFCDELKLPEAIVAIALKHVVYKQGQYSRTGSIYQLSGAQCVSLEQSLKAYAAAHPRLGKAFQSPNMAPGNRDKYQRFLNWKAARGEIDASFAAQFKH